MGDLNHKSLHLRVIPIPLSMSELLVHATIVNLARDWPLVFDEFEPLAHPLFGDQIITLQILLFLLTHHLLIELKLYLTSVSEIQIWSFIVWRFFVILF